MKAGIRTVGFDDAPHTRPDGRVPVVGVHMRGSESVERVLLTDVARDGGDATNRLARCYHEADLPGVKAILIDGAALAGFNVVDLAGLAAECDVPTISVTKGVPDMVAMQAAIQHVPDAEAKWRILTDRPAVTWPMPEGGPITVSWAGCDEAQARALLAATTRRGHIPEPVRLAHLIARIAR